MVSFNKQALKSDIELYLKTYAFSYARSAAEKYTEAAKKTIIDVYYGQYDPIYYDRTNDLMDNSYYKYFKNNGTTVYGGVVISDRDMTDYVNIWHVYDIAKGTFGEGLENVYDVSSRTPASNVVQWAWTKGYHGYMNRNKEDRIYTFPPLAALQIEIGTIQPQIQQEAISVAKSQNYAFLQF